MIQSKHIICEGHYEVIVGIITMDGQIKSQETQKTHEDLNFRRGTCWRYNPLKKTTYWHGDDSEHDETDEINVAEHIFRKYGYRVDSNVILYGSLDDDNYIQKHDDSHGITENNDRINSFKKELKDFIKKYRESDHPSDKEHLARLIKIAREEIEVEKKKTPDQRAHEFDRNQFMKHHYTGHIGSDAYRNYEKEGGLKWLGDKSKWPELLDKGQFGPFFVEFRQRGEKNEYVTHDENGEIKRLPNGDPIYMTDAEKRAENLPLKDTSIAAFVNDKPIGLASNEFGTVGVWVEGPYQKQGIGVALMSKHIEQRPDVQSGRNKIGQMTNAGYNMTQRYYEKLTKKYGPGWFQKWKQEKNINESDTSDDERIEKLKKVRHETKILQDELQKKYPQAEDLWFGVGLGGVLHISMLRIKPEFRRQGIGKSIIRDIKKFADTNDLMITLHPQAEWGYKRNLDKFYRDAGFIHNKGKNKNYQYSSPFAPTMYRKPGINEGTILMNQEDKSILDEYIVNMETEIKALFKNTPYIESEELIDHIKHISDKVSSNQFPFNIEYVFKANGRDEGYFDKDKNAIIIVVSAISKWDIGFDRTKGQIFRCYSVDFNKMASTFVHEFIHYIQHVYRQENQGEYNIPSNWDDSNKYWKRGWEQQAHGIGYLEKLRKELGIREPSKLLHHLRKLGLFHNDSLNKLKKSDPKSWRAIMKQAVMSTLADIDDSKKVNI